MNGFLYKHNYEDDENVNQNSTNPNLLILDAQIKNLPVVLHGPENITLPNPFLFQTIYSIAADPKATICSPSFCTLLELSSRWDIVFKSYTGLAGKLQGLKGLFCVWFMYGAVQSYCTIALT